MKRIYLLLLGIAIILASTSCDKNEKDPVIVPTETTEGYYILNTGSWGKNNASLSYYDFEYKIMSNNVFLDKNEKKLGDLAQDMIVYGNKMYISVQNSAIIFVTDKKGEILAEITDPVYTQPHSFVAYNGDVFVTYYDGAIGKIDTTSFAVNSVKMGNNPEQLKMANGNFYIANSGGMNYPNYGTTVSIVNPADLTLIKELEVGLNPRYIQADAFGNVYVLTVGDYGAVLPSLKKIDPQGNVVTLDIKNGEESLPPSYIGMGSDNYLYVISGKSDESTGWKLQGDIYSFNTQTQKIEGKFITDGTTIENISGLSVDLSTGEVGVPTSDYINTGDFYIFSKEGVLNQKLPVGVNPVKFVPVSID